MCSLIPQTFRQGLSQPGQGRLPSGFRWQVLCAGLSSALSMPRTGKLSCPPTSQIPVSTLRQCLAPGFPSRGSDNKDTLKAGGGTALASSSITRGIVGSHGEDKAASKGGGLHLRPAGSLDNPMDFLFLSSYKHITASTTVSWLSGKKCHFNCNHCTRSS